MSSMMESELKSPLIQFITENLRRYPVSEVRDIYKLLYQAYHGAEHAVVDSEQARGWLMREWNELAPGGPDDNSPVLEPIFIDGVTPRLYRLHFGPAKAKGTDPELIFCEFMRASREFPRMYPTEKDDLHASFLRAWIETGQGISSGEIVPSSGDFMEFTTAAEWEGWGAYHHSDVYRKAYNPHYRLVMDRF